jgi:hypothetical protein
LEVVEATPYAVVQRPVNHQHLAVAGHVVGTTSSVEREQSERPIALAPESTEGVALGDSLGMADILTKQLRFAAPARKPATDASMTASPSSARWASSAVVAASSWDRSGTQSLDVGREAACDELHDVEAELRILIGHPAFGDEIEVV